MLLTIRHALRRGVVAVVAFCAWVGVYPGIYLYTVTAQAGTFLNNAQAGQNAGVSAIAGAEYDVTSNGEQDFDSLGWQAPAGMQKKLESYYKPGNVGLSGGNALNQYASDEGALLQSTTCPAGFPGAGNIAADFQSMQKSCQAAWTPFLQGATTWMSENGGPDGAFGQSLENLKAQWGEAFGSAQGTVDGIASDCVQAPACDLASAAQLSGAESALENTSSGLPEIQAYCASLPTAMPTGSSAIDAEMADLQSVATNLGNLTYDNRGIQGLYDTCTYAQSYALAQQGTGGINGFTSGANGFDQGANISDFLDTQEGQSLETSILPIVEGNPEVFAQYYTPSDCKNTTLYIENNGQTVSTPSTTTTSGGTAPSQAISCNETGADSGLIANFPVSGAEWIWGDGSQCGDVPDGTSETLMATIENGAADGGSNPNGPIAATAYFAAMDQGTLTISDPSTGTSTTLSYNDGGKPLESAYPQNGWIQQAVTIEPGVNSVGITVQGDAAAGDAAAAIAAIVASNGTVLLETTTASSAPTAATSSTSVVGSAWSMVTGAATPVVATTAPGTAETVSSPSASINSTICTGTPFRCLGTECHALIGNQNLDFAKAVTASSAIQMMQASIQCEAGTSVAAGNCIPIIFQGNEMYCRTWPFGGTFTNNCCSEGLEGAGVNIGKYISLLNDAYHASASPIVAKTVFSLPSQWADGAYKALSDFGGKAWNFISQKFVNVAEELAQDLGATGASVITTITGGVANSSGELFGSLASAENTALSDAASSVINANSGGIFSQINESVDAFEQKLETYAEQAMVKMGVASSTAAAKAIISYVIKFANVVMWAYTIYQIAQLIANLLTTCKQEEFELGNYRKDHDCQMVGTYCADKSLFGCLMHKTTFCCYQSPLARIIASQIQIGQPNVAGGYGQAKDPDCNGFTPQQLAVVNWSEINLSQWLALLEQGGLIQTTNQAAAAANPASAITHPTGQVND